MNSKPESQQADENDVVLDDALASQHQQNKKLHAKQAGLIAGVLAFAAIAFLAANMLLTPDKDKTTDQVNLIELSDQEINELRESFKRLLVGYEQQLEPIILSDYMQAFSGDRVTRIEQDKKNALAAFARSDFVVASAAIKKAISNGELLINDWQQAFDDAMQKALEHFSNDDIDAARFAYRQALALNPSDPSLLALGERINAYDQVAKMLTEYRAAIAENNIEKQLTLLQQALALDPQRKDLIPLLQSTKQEKKKKDTAYLVQQANSALDEGQMANAEQLLRQASGISPGDAGVAAAQSRLKEMRKTQALLANLSDIQTSIENDNWQKVEALVKRSLNNYPNNTHLLELNELAQEINLQHGRLLQYAQRTHVLYDKSIRSQLKSLLGESNALQQYSASMAQTASALQNQIQLLETPVEITFVSDGRTQVTLFKVIALGQFTQRVQPVLPGSYRLEGKCEGYQTVQKELVVKPGESQPPVIIQCEKRI